MLRRILLKNFRCHCDFDSYHTLEKLQLDDVASDWVHISGPNGCGKTSVLEAISFLSPGRGMRGASTAEVTTVGSCQPWCAKFVFDDRTLILTHKTHDDTARRVIKDNTGEIAWHKHISVLWITPQSAVRFFLSKQERRLCMDRWVASVLPDYHVAWRKYHSAYRHWARCCKVSVANSAAFEAFEVIMIREAAKITEMRVRWREMVLIHFSCELEVQSPDIVAVNWACARRVGNFNGPHNADLRLVNGRDHALCSTGEQKMMFFRLVYAVSQVQPADYKLLLLDDWYENFDAANRTRITEMLACTPLLTVWSSGLAPIEAT